jgi:hypothetical protein
MIDDDATAAVLAVGTLLLNRQGSTNRAYVWPCQACHGLVRHRGGEWRHEREPAFDHAALPAVSGLPERPVRRHPWLRATVSWLVVIWSVIALTIIAMGVPSPAYALTVWLTVSAVAVYFRRHL